MVRKKFSISIFFPFLNDWGTIGSLVALSVSTVSKLTDDWEVIIVNDGSKELDRKALEAVVDLYYDKNKVRIFNHEKNRGYGGALRSGFEQAKKDLVFYTDGDAQYDPRELDKLYYALKEDTVMVNGYKMKRHDPFYRTVIGRIYHHVVKLAFGLPIRDTDCDFRLIRKNVFSKVKLHENTGTICVELVKKISHFYPGKIVEVPVHHFWRTSGKSQFFNLDRLFKTFNNLYKLWWKLIIQKDYLK